MHRHETTHNDAAPTKAAGTVQRIVLFFSDVNREEICHECWNDQPERPIYQRACKQMLVYELDFRCRLTKIKVIYRKGLGAELEEIDRLTLHQRAGEEAIRQHEEAA